MAFVPIAENKRAENRRVVSRMERKKRNRIAALLLAVTILVIMLYSAFFVAVEADHDCVGEGCPICYQVDACQNTLKSLSLAVCVTAVAVAFTYILCRCISLCTDNAQRDTLVSLKVKLSNEIRSFCKGEVYLFSDRLLRRCRYPCIFVPIFSSYYNLEVNIIMKKIIALLLALFMLVGGADD